MAVARASQKSSEDVVSLLDDGLRVLPDDVVLDLRGDEAQVVLEHGRLILNPAPVGWGRRALTRLFDVVGAAVLSFVFAPIVVACAVGVRLTSPGPVFYGSERVARGGGTFDALKLRSMHVDADQALNAHLQANPDAAAEYYRTFKLADDPRVTPFGAWMRRWSLDELPQLLNVLRGEMSLVGPRPKLLTEQARYGETLPTVLRVKPGLTGLWQVSGRSNLPFRDRILLDLDYAVKPTIRRDITICLKTASQMLRSGDNGAY